VCTLRPRSNIISAPTYKFARLCVGMLVCRLTCNVTAKLKPTVRQKMKFTTSVTKESNFQETQKDCRHFHNSMHLMCNCVMIIENVTV
jgi:hypothetical protein